MIYHKGGCDVVGKYGNKNHSVVVPFHRCVYPTVNNGIKVDPLAGSSHCACMCLFARALSSLFRGIHSGMISSISNKIQVREIPFLRLFLD